MRRLIFLDNCGVYMWHLDAVWVHYNTTAWEAVWIILMSVVCPTNWCSNAFSFKLNYLSLLLQEAALHKELYPHASVCVPHTQSCDCFHQGRDSVRCRWDRQLPAISECSVFLSEVLSYFSSSALFTVLSWSSRSRRPYWLIRIVSEFT